MDETVNDSSGNLNQSDIDISTCVLRIFVIAAIIFAFRKMNFLEIQKFEF